jgi:hypothetical protein
VGVHCTLTGVRGMIAPFLGVFLMNHVFRGDPHYVFFLSSALIACAAFLSLRMAQVERRHVRDSGHVDGGGAEQ